MKSGCLIVGGAGISVFGQASIETLSAIRAADKVFCVLSDELAQNWVNELNPAAQSLQYCYDTEADRPAAYLAMVDEILRPVREGYKVCALFYGHPGVFVWPSHEALRRARAEGYEARMLPAISAEDCLFADLLLDPARHGCQSFEARDFLLNARIFDPCAALILWQIAVLGDGELKRFTRSEPGAMEALSRVLREIYPVDHEVIVYEAPVLPIERPRIERVGLSALASVALSEASTLYVPAMAEPSPSLGRAQLLSDCMRRAREAP